MLMRVGSGRSRFHAYENPLWSDKGGESRDKDSHEWMVVVDALSTSVAAI